jgi:predicted nucleotidyltransferase
MTDYEKIKNICESVVNPIEVYLFGSSLYNEKKANDIDIMIIGDFSADNLSLLRTILKSNIKKRVDLKTATLADVQKYRYAKGHIVNIALNGLKL